MGILVKAPFSVFHACLFQNLTTSHIYRELYFCSKVFRFCLNGLYSLVNITNMFFFSGYFCVLFSLSERLQVPRGHRRRCHSYGGRQRGSNYKRLLAGSVRRFASRDGYRRWVVRRWSWLLRWVLRHSAWLLGRVLVLHPRPNLVSSFELSMIWKLITQSLFFFPISGRVLVLLLILISTGLQTGGKAVVACAFARWKS